MIITRISGGLGNQMFQYAIAKSLATKNNDVFKMDVSFYQKQTLRKYELNFFQIEENIATDEESIFLRGKEGLYYKIQKKLKLNITRPSTYKKEFEASVFDKNIFRIIDDCYIDGFWQNEKYFYAIRDEIITDFMPKISLGIEAQRYIEDMKKTNSVSLHVRRGDYVADANANSVHGTCDIEYYKRAIEYINSNVSTPIFYIFSDDIQWCKENFFFLKDKIFIDKTKNAIEDLELMKNCHYNIIANSTFSWWGAWLNKHGEKIVISPKIWWNAKPEDHIAPENWIRL